MDTKWKKCKGWIGIIAFCLGLGILLHSLLSGITQLNTLRENVSSITETDYQNSRDFRNFISGRLESFLGMATGGPVDGWNSYNYYSWYDYPMTYSDGAYGYAVESLDGVTIQKEDLEALTYDLGVTAENQGGYSAEELEDILLSYGYSPESGFPADDKQAAEYRKQQAEQFHERIRNDKNLLYIIQYEGKTLFTNAEGTGLTGGSSPSLPDGYNFLLIFDGEKVKITKDGNDIDIYGDGYYRESSDWYMPGYKNFTVDEKTKKAEIVIAAAKSPIMYMSGDYSTDGCAQSVNQLYWIERNMADAHRSIKALMIRAGIALLLLILALLLRKDRKAAIRRISSFTGKHWFEVKLSAAIAAAVFGMGLCRGIARFIILSAKAFSLGAEEYGYYMPEIIYETSYELQSRPLSSIAGIAIFIFILCLLIGDIRYNEKPWRHSLFGKLFQLFHDKSLTMSIQKQLMYPYGTMTAMLFVVLIVYLIITIHFFSYINHSDYVRSLPYCVVFLVLLLTAIAWTIFFAVKNRRTARDLGTLTRQIAAVKQGDLTRPVGLSKNSPLAKASQDLNEIRQGLDTAVEEQIKSERMKVELVSNVSHDIKTPLTSIISYVDLLNQEEELPEHIRDYVKILNDKSQRLKAMVQDVFEISKAASGQLPVEMEQIDLGKLLRQTLADMEEVIQSSNVSLKTGIPETPVMIHADGQRLYRVFQNLIQNALQYSLEGSRVYLTLTCDSRTALTVVKNISQSELRNDIDFTARFTRGDASRTDGGSGLGLSIAQSFTEACGGSFKVETNADLFTVTVEFPVTVEPCS